MRYMVIVEKGESSYGAFVPDLPGCIAVGETEQEVIVLIQEAIQFHRCEAGSRVVPRSDRAGRFHGAFFAA